LAPKTWALNLGGLAERGFSALVFFKAFLHLSFVRFTHGSTGASRQVWVSSAQLHSPLHQCLPLYFLLLLYGHLAQVFARLTPLINRGVQAGLGLFRPITLPVAPMFALVLSALVVRAFSAGFCAFDPIDQQGRSGRSGSLPPNYTPRCTNVCPCTFCSRCTGI